MTTPIKDSCGKCYFWLQLHFEQKPTSGGFCRRKPPAFVQESAKIGRGEDERNGLVCTQMHPQTCDNDWCGKFRNSETEHIRRENHKRFWKNKK